MRYSQKCTAKAELGKIKQKKYLASLLIPRDLECPNFGRYCCWSPWLDETGAPRSVSTAPRGAAVFVRKAELHGCAPASCRNA